MKINKIFLHWSAGLRTQIFTEYHSIVTGDGVVHRSHPYTQQLGGHTAGRNDDSVAISAACMYNWDWKNQGPTPKQIDSLCCEAAKVAKGLGWKADKDFLEHRIMTHAEAAGLRDYPLDLVKKVSNLPMYKSAEELKQRTKLAASLKLPHDNYGPTHWFDNWPGGYAERLDFIKTSENGKDTFGGYELRDQIIAWMEKLK